MCKLKKNACGLDGRKSTNDRQMELLTDMICFFTDKQFRCNSRSDKLMTIILRRLKNYFNISHYLHGSKSA